MRNERKKYELIRSILEKIERVVDQGVDRKSMQLVNPLVGEGNFPNSEIFDQIKKSHQNP